MGRGRRRPRRRSDFEKLSDPTRGLPDHAESPGHRATAALDEPGAAGVCAFIVGTGAKRLTISINKGLDLEHFFRSRKRDQAGAL